MTIALAKDVEDFVNDQVRRGVCDDPAKLVNDTLRSLREFQKKPFRVTNDLEAWLLESAESAITPLTKADFAAIRKRTPARKRSRRS